MAGSLRQRGRSSWELRVHAGRDELTGRKLYVTKTVRGGRREAERELARLVASVDDGAKVVKAGTVAELCEKWFEITAPELSPAVAAEYRRLLDQRILPRWGTTGVRRLRTADLDIWYAQLRRSGRAGGLPLAANSVGRIHGVLRRALNQGVRWGWLTSSPAVVASPPRIHRHSLEVPTAADITKLISAAAQIHPAFPSSSVSPPPRLPAAVSCAPFAGAISTSTAASCISPERSSS